ncbi:DUF4115 domain-containing protein [Pseudomonadales bacterium]|nr:DUF4115 domain-containing protein [Pseudomonadales bacterium]
MGIRLDSLFFMFFTSLIFCFAHAENDRSEGISCLGMSFAGDSWFEIKRNGTPLYADLGRANQQRCYAVHTPVSITFGVATLSSLYVDGREIPLRERTNDVAKVTLPNIDGCFCGVGYDSKGRVGGNAFDLRIFESSELELKVSSEEFSRSIEIVRDPSLFKRSEVLLAVRHVLKENSLAVRYDALHILENHDYRKEEVCPILNMAMQAESGPIGISKLSKKIGCSQRTPKAQIATEPKEKTNLFAAALLAYAAYEIDKKERKSNRYDLSKTQGMKSSDVGAELVRQKREKGIRGKGVAVAPPKQFKVEDFQTGPVPNASNLSSRSQERPRQYLYSRVNDWRDLQSEPDITGCRCLCVGGKKESLCSSPLSTGRQCSGSCPLPTKNYEPTNIEVPPPGTTKCRSLQVLFPEEGRYKTTSVCS